MQTNNRHWKQYFMAGAVCAVTLLLTGRGMAQETVFSDNFQNGLDASKWETIQRPGSSQGTAKAEAEYYVASALTTDSSGLHIVARRQGHTDPKTGTPFAFTSGRLESRETFTYGRFEFRAKLPAGKGFWPALWLRTPEGHPQEGEIDVIEGFGSHPNAIQSTLHVWQNGQHLGQHGAQVGLDWRNNEFQKVTSKLDNDPDFSADYHTFAVDWRADHVTWYLDGKEYYKETRDVPSVPMRIVLNLAVGGGFDGPPNDQTPFPSSLDVASVRVTR